MKTVYTIGHSNRSFEEFVRLLKAHGVEQVLDVRSIPASRRNPQFARETLAAALRARRIGYRWVKKLGGRRSTRKDSPNTGWRNLSFRGFADYMATEPFAQGLEVVETIAQMKPAALMCAEAVPWRCHRSLIADALTKRRWSVCHISGPGVARKHRLTPFLSVRKGLLIYPEAEA